MNSNLPPDDQLQSHVDRVTEGVDPAAEAAAIERAAAAATTALLRERGLPPVPSKLSERLKADMETFVRTDRKVVRPSFGKEVASWTGWLAAAACLAWLLILEPYRRPTGNSAPVAELAQRLQADGNALKVSFAPGPAGEGGEVLWSNQRQEGVLALHGIPPNDPRREQYQLWIVDPRRDAKFPVDGGVFDVTSAGGTTWIPVDAKLRIEQPTAFVITREQPGGVVKSQAVQPVLVASVR